MTLLILILLIIALGVGVATFFKPVKTGNLRHDFYEGLRQNREELSSALIKNQETTNNALRQQSDSIYNHLSALTEAINDKFDKQFKNLQDSNEKKLTQIQTVVDEKLQETLNRRISQSFEQVTTLLNDVNKGMGEMRGLAADVDSLSKVMTGVKTRGIVGEMQLSRILSDSLAPSQYRAQEPIKDNTHVDYAIVMPGKDTASEVLLPIDSKFPLEDYQRLQKALEANDSAEIDLTRKALYSAVKTQAKSIAEKYIFPPKTTDFAILFLPTEGLFMEIVNNPALYEQIQRDYKVNLTGPTTMTAVLNSLQMGFKTLQIEQKSSEVYQILGKVKTEFDKYETALLAVQKDLQKSNSDIDKLISTRTNMMKRSLSSIEKIELTTEEDTRRS